MTSVFPYLRKHNHDLRPREYLYESEINDLIKAARLTRNPLRNQTMILIGFRRGLRPSETIHLKWRDICFRDNVVTIQRLKNGITGKHHIYDKEVLFLKKLHKQHLETKCTSPFVFVTCHGTPLTISTYEKLCEKLGEMIALPFKFHPHMLRHSWGEYAREKKVDVIDMKEHFGHRDIRNTLKYVEERGYSNFPSLFN